MKRKTRRSEAKYPALDPQLNLRTRSEQLDFDYIDSLPETWTDPLTGKKWNPKQFLNDFTNESVHAEFKKKKRIHRKKKVPSEKNKDLKILLEKLLEKVRELIQLLNDSNASNSLKVKVKKSITKMKKQIQKQIKGDYTFIEDFFKKEAYDKNNSRNRCVLTRSKASGRLSNIDDLHENNFSTNNVEDSLIELIDNKHLNENE